jgi:hypothetical protein
MKHVLSLLVFVLGVFTPAYSQAQSQLREVGTNVFDFSPVARSFQKQEVTSSSFLVMGEVIQVNENGAYIERKVPNLQLSQEFTKEMMLAGAGQQLKMLFAEKELEKWRNGQLSTGEILVMDHDTKQYILDEIEREQNNFTYIRVLVTNCPNASVLQGKQVKFFALPVGTATFTDSENNLLSISRFDYGFPYAGATSNRTVFLVTQNGFIKKESSQEAEAKKEAAVKTLVAWQLQQASNGVAYVQFDLAKRYLKGDGVQQDDLLGHYWLMRSAEQNYEPAVKLLKQPEN